MKNRAAIGAVLPPLLLLQMRRRRHSFRKPTSGGDSQMEDIVDPDYLRDTVGKNIYDRVMQWNDSGAVEALAASQERQRAKETRKPCWVPKLKKDLYISRVDWNMNEFGEACDIPQSAVDLAKEIRCGRCVDKTELSPSPQPLFIYEDEGKPCDAVLEDCGNGQRLIVGGWPIEPSGWGDVEPTAPLGTGLNYASENEAAMLSSCEDVAIIADAVLDYFGQGQQFHVGELPVEPTGWSEQYAEFPVVYNGPCIVDSVLEDFGDGPKLLVGGWPVQPSWDQLDDNWSQLGWVVHNSTYGKGFNADSCGNKQSECISNRQLECERYFDQFNNIFSEGHYLTAR